MLLHNVDLQEAKAVTQGASKDDLLAAVAAVAAFKVNAAFWAGDILNALHAKLGDSMWDHVTDEFLAGMSIGDVNRVMAIAKRVPKNNRVPGASWTSHARASSLPESIQHEVLSKAVADGLTTGETTARIRQITNGGYDDWSY